MTDLICPQCGEVVPVGERGRKRRFCSDACRQRWHDDNDDEYNRPDPINMEIDQRPVSLVAVPDDDFRTGAKFWVSDFVDNNEMCRAMSPGSVYDCWPVGLILRIRNKRNGEARYWVRPDYSLGRVM